jgi:hypothetical protein
VSVLARLRELPPELRNAGIAAAALAVSMFFPWYQESYVPRGAREFVQKNLSAFNVFSFVEAAILLVAGGVMFLIWSRAQGRAFHLPGGDGVAISLAGGWALLLLVWRLFDKPDVDDPGATVGIQWGIFVALLAAGALFAAGARVRAVHRPEPPLPAADEDDSAGPPPHTPRPPRRRTDSTAVTEVLGERPDWSGEPPEAPGRARPSEPSPPESEPRPSRDETDRLF